MTQTDPSTLSELASDLKSDFESIGLEVNDTQRIEDNDQIDLIIEQIVSYGNYTLFVYHFSDRAGVSIRFQYNIARQLGLSLSDEQIRKLISVEDGMDEQQIQILAGKELLRQLSEKDMARIDYSLSDRLLSPEVTFSIARGDENEYLITGYEVTRDIYPTEHDYSLHTLDHTVRSVITMSVSGQRFLGRIFQIDAENQAQVDEPDSIGLSTEFSELP